MKVLGVKVEDSFYDKIAEFGKISDVLRVALEFYINHIENKEVNHTEEQVNPASIDCSYCDYKILIDDLIRRMRGS